MCTVSFIPVKDKILITSNRDEKHTRKQAIPPALYKVNSCHMLFPKDSDAGGSWIILKENGDAAVLLNGAFIPHQPEPPYRKSRGLLLMDILGTQMPSQTFTKIHLDSIEPFTIVLFEKDSLYEFRWDGTERYCKQLNSSRPHIWSSATLYDGLEVKKREQWFVDFLNRIPHPTQQDILHFHRFTGEGDSRNDLLMNRDGIYSTVSITGILVTADRGSMKYLDTKNNKLSEIKIELATTITSE